MPFLIFAAIALLVGVPAVAYWMDKCFEPPAKGTTALARVGASATAYFEQNLGVFNWNKYRALITAMYRYPANRPRGIVLLNRDHPGKGDALASGMSLVDAGVLNNPVAILQIQTIAAQAKAGSAEMAGPYAMLRVINEARKAALAGTGGSMSAQAYNDEMTLRAMEPSESFEQDPYAMMSPGSEMSPYSMMKW